MISCSHFDSVRFKVHGITADTLLQSSITFLLMIPRLPPLLHPSRPLHLLHHTAAGPPPIEIAVTTGTHRVRGPRPFHRQSHTPPGRLRLRCVIRMATWRGSRGMWSSFGRDGQATAHSLSFLCLQTSPAHRVPLRQASVLAASLPWLLQFSVSMWIR